MNTTEFINEIKSRLRDMPEDTHTGILLRLAQFIPYDERSNALEALAQYGNRAEKIYSTPCLSVYAH
jgi:hypothetical protein